jgi:hypothetical protein
MIIAIGFIILFILMDAIKLKLLSIVLGVTVGILAYPYFQGQGQVKVHGPDSNIVRKEVHVLKNKCYKYEPIPYLCGVSRSN